MGTTTTPSGKQTAIEGVGAMVIVDSENNKRLREWAASAKKRRGKEDQAWTTGVEKGRGKT